jgi:phage minor structural protein
MDTVRDESGLWSKVMAVESWKLLGKTYPTINNDPYYPWPPDRKGDAYNDPDHGWIIPDALVVCIVSGGDNLSGGLYQTGTAAHALHVLLKDTGWTLGTVDVTGTYDLETEKESTLANIQEVQKIWGGMLVWEYVFDDNDKIVERKLHLRNEDTWQNYTGFQIRYAKNLKHITRSDNNDIVTRLYPFGENDLDIYAINDGKKYVENYSYTDSILFGVFKDQKIHDQQELKEKAEKALAKMCKPRRTYRIKMADLRTLPEYQHEDFQLGDIVDVIDEDLSINLQARIVRHRHNVFMPWQCELEVGEPEERLVSSLKSSFDIAKYVKETVRPNKGISQIVKGVLDTFHTAIQGAGGDFEVSDGVATWWETDDEGERTGNLVRITPKGMLISDDGGQTSQLAITGEGIAAEAIVGTLGMFAKVRADQIVIGDDGEKIPSELLDTSYIDTQVDELDIAMSNLGNTITNAFSDGYITNIEAQSLNLARNSVVKEATDVKAIATSLQVSTTALTTAINTLNTEVNKYVGKSSYPIAVTAANRTALNNAFTALEAAIVALYAAIDQKQIAEVMDYVDIQKKDLDESIGELDDIIATAFSDNVITNIEAQSLKTAMWSILQEAGDVFSIADALGIDTDDVEETTDVLYALLTENYIDQEEYPIEVSTINREAILSAFADLETAIVALYEAIDQKRISNVSSSLTNYIDGIGTTLTGLIDSKIDTWFYEGTPTLTNNPAKDWTTNTIKDKHLDDLYYNTANGYVYRFVYESNAYKWVRIKDTDIVAAMQIASLAQDTADSKRRIFVTQPVPPYDIGDLWRVTNVSGVDFKICTATRLVGDYDANDWANVDKTKDYIDTQKQELDGAIGDLDDTISTAFSDGVITNIEAQGLKIARDSVVKEATDVKAIATSLQVSTTALTTAINTLNTEVNKYVGKSSYPIAVTAANRTALNNAFTNLETAIVTLYESIDIKRASDIDSTLRDDLQLASPLPGYVKLGSEGVRVYDAQNNIRGIFGSWLADAIRKYGIKIIDGEIYSTTFQTGAEDATTYIRLDPSGDFSAFCDGDRMIFMQASAYEGRIHLSTANDEYEGLRLTASFNFNQIPCGGVSGTSGGLTNRGLHLHAHGDIIMNPGGGYEVYVSGNHFVTGSKNAIMPTDSYGQRLLYSYETPESKFMDEGTAELISGFCRIDIDPIFLETIEPNTPETPFIVHLTPYDWLNLRVAEMGNSYFIVEEKDGLSGKFSWQLSATRRGYAGVRLEQVDDGEELLTSNWEDDLFEFAGQED